MSVRIDGDGDAGVTTMRTMMKMTRTTMASLWLLLLPSSDIGGFDRGR